MLIEALVSILILSLGLLGIAGLQLNALAYQKSSWSTHRVAELTNDIAERIRANPPGAASGSYLYVQDYETAKSASIATNNCRSAAVPCTTAQIASDDLSAWLLKAQSSLPGGAVRLEGGSIAGYTVTAVFADKEFRDSTGALQTSATCTPTTSGTAWRSCCSADLAVPAGVRCSRSTVIP